MDILYIVGRGSTWGNNELRYSLRSIAKYGINVGCVFICGYIPRWVNRDKVICLDFDDQTNCKHTNICNAITYACKFTNIGNNKGDFLYSSDDHFYVQPTDFDNYPIFYKGYLPEQHRYDETIYETTLANTAQILAAHRLGNVKYCWHGNTHFNRNEWLGSNIQTMLREGYKLKESVEPTCIMLNYLAHKKRLKVLFKDDRKISRNASVDDIRQIVATREVISSVPDIGGTGLHDFLAMEFPTKCKYEAY